MGGGNKGYFKDSTARDQIETKIEGLVYPREDHTSLTARMDNIKAQGKNGAYIMYCSSVNPDFATIGYCTAIGLTINTAVSVIVAVNSQTGDIWTNGNTSQDAGAWTGWKKVRSGYSKQTLTTTDYPLLYSNLILIRSGNVVSILFRGFKNLTANAENIIISALPTEFRPSEEVHHVIFQGGVSTAMARISISPAGAVKIWPYGDAPVAGASNMNDTFTYVI